MKTKQNAMLSYTTRYFVADLSPEQRPELSSLPVRWVFVAESPHLAEVAPESRLVRRPLCGKAGREWWSMLAAVTGDRVPSNELSAGELMAQCVRLRMAVLNAVQCPLDPKIMLHYGAAADPVKGLGFCKVGEFSFKKQKKQPCVEDAIANLRERLLHPSLAFAPVISLGNDAQWFVERALGEKLGVGRNQRVIPHPSAWWRQGGKLRLRAKTQLVEYFGDFKFEEAISSPARFETQSQA